MDYEYYELRMDGTAHECGKPEETRGYQYIHEYPDKPSATAIRGMITHWRDLVWKDREIVEDSWVLYRVRYDAVLGGEFC